MAFLPSFGGTLPVAKTVFITGKGPTCHSQRRPFELQKAMSCHPTGHVSRRQPLFSARQTAILRSLFIYLNGKERHLTIDTLPCKTTAPTAKWHSVQPCRSTNSPPIRQLKTQCLHSFHSLLWFIRKPFGWTYGSIIKCDTLFHLQIHPAIIQAVGKCDYALRRGMP